MLILQIISTFMYRYSYGNPYNYVIVCLCYCVLMKITIASCKRKCLARVTCRFSQNGANVVRGVMLGRSNL